MNLVDLTPAPAPPRSPDEQGSSPMSAPPTSPDAHLVRRPATALAMVEADDRVRLYSYDDLERRSNQVATWLGAQGLAPGQAIVVVLGQRVELWEITLAVLKIGATVIPVDPSSGPELLHEVLSTPRVNHVVTADAHRDVIDGLPTTGLTRIAVGQPATGWTSYSSASLATDARPEHATARPPHER